MVALEEVAAVLEKLLHMALGILLRLILLKGTTEEPETREHTAPEVEAVLELSEETVLAQAAELLETGVSEFLILSLVLLFIMRAVVGVVTITERQARVETEGVAMVV